MLRNECAPEKMKAACEWATPARVRIDWKKIVDDVPPAVVDCLKAGEKFKEIKEAGKLEKRRGKYTKMMVAFDEVTQLLQSNSRGWARDRPKHHMADERGRRRSSFCL